MDELLIRSRGIDKPTHESMNTTTWRDEITSGDFFKLDLSLIIKVCPSIKTLQSFLTCRSPICHQHRSQKFLKYFFVFERNILDNISMVYALHYNVSCLLQNMYKENNKSLLWYAVRKWRRTAATRSSVVS